MNFFNENCKPQKGRLANRAYDQLKKRIHQRWSYTKSEPKSPKKDDRYQIKDYLKGEKIQNEKIEQINNQKRANSCLLSSKNKQLNYHIAKRNSNSSNEVLNNSKVNLASLSQTKQLPDSFSSYVIKNKGKLNQKIRNNLNLHYFDLDQIVNHLATPIKLENKIHIEESLIQRRKAKLQNLGHYHSFFKDVEKDKLRYNELQKINIHSNGVRTEQNMSQKSSYLFKREIYQIETQPFWRRNRKNKDNHKGFQNLIPWTENQEENSPLLSKRNRAITKAMQYSDSEAFKINQ